MVIKVSNKNKFPLNLIYCYLLTLTLKSYFIKNFIKHSKVNGGFVVINRYCSTIDTLKAQQGCQYNPEQCTKYADGK